MLAQGDTSLEPSWPKMTPRIDFLNDFIILDNPNAPRSDAKIKQFSDIPRNLVFCEWSSQKLQNESPTPLQNLVFSGKW